MLYGVLLLGLLPLVFMTDLFGDDDMDDLADEGQDAAGAPDGPDTTGDNATGSPLDYAVGVSGGVEAGVETDGQNGPEVVATAEGAQGDTVQSDATADQGAFPDEVEAAPTDAIDVALDAAEGDAAEGAVAADKLDGPDDLTAQVLTPTDPDDEEPGDPGDPVDPDDVLRPIDPEDAPPGPGEPVNPEDVLKPIDDPDEGLPVDGSLVEHAVQRDGDAVAGLDDFDRVLGDTVQIEGSDAADDIALDHDGVPGGGAGDMSLWDGTPLIQSDGDVTVVDGAGGDDVIKTGDGAAYAFGGAGHDQITVGDGAAAAFGGDGNDTLTGGASDSYLDGGAGNDVIQGGDGNEVLKGGVHRDNTGESDDDVIDGGAGDDRISGGEGADLLSGGAGDDVIDHNGRATENDGAERHEFSWHLDGDADVLDGGAGDDTLIMDLSDQATGGDGADVFWLYADETTAEYAEVTDFEPGEDFLRIELNPDTTYGEVELEVQPSPDGQDGEVYVNGQLVALLQGAPTATSANVYVSVQENVFR